MMRTVESPDAIRAAVREERAVGRSIALVPTMGALHEGHRSLIAAARAEHDVVILSIFVNPLQFDRTQDLDRYPRDLEADLDSARDVGVDLCFTPAPVAMYPDGEPVVRVDAGSLGGMLEGASRPGHFTGLATVVTKLLVLTCPDAAYFGEKDFQQLVVVRRLVADLCLPTVIVGRPIVREPDGLALSSRNRRLSVAEREAATVLHAAIVAGRSALASGAGRTEVEATMAGTVRAEPLARLDYAVVTGPSLEVPSEPLTGSLRLLIAAEVGPVRLIDNLEASV